MEVKVMNVGPSIASFWLRKSKGNPRWKSGKMVDPNRVSKIAKDIVDGKWNSGNNSIAFDSNGVLVDGHHRLHAIIKAKQEVECIVVFGINEDGLKHIDENRTRTVSQRTGIDKAAVAVANCHYWMENGSSVCNTLTAEETIIFVEEHPLVYDAISLSSAGIRRAPGKKAGIQHALLCALETGVMSEVVEKFMRCVNTGFIDGPHESAAVVLRNTLFNTAVRARGDSLYIDCSTQNALRDFIDKTPRKYSYTFKNYKGFYFSQLYS